VQRGKAAALGHCPGHQLSGRRRRSGRLSLRYNEWRGDQQLVHTLCKMRTSFHCTMQQLWAAPEQPIHLEVHAHLSGERPPVVPICRTSAWIPRLTC